jgi:hypothetical protein
MTPEEIKAKQDAKAAAGQAQIAGKVEVENVKGANKQKEIAAEHQAELATNLIENSMTRATGSELRAQERSEIG